MPFDHLHMLHFACVAVLEDPVGKDAMDPCLLFEATVDGDPQDFLDELIAFCGEGLDLVYRHCVGYPVSGHHLPHLVKSYLNGHALAPNIEFQGHPGRSLAEIHGEDALRKHLVNELERYTYSAPDFSGTRHTILRDIRRRVAEHPKYKWSMEERAEPFETEHGRRITFLAGFLLITFIGIAAIVFSSPDSGTYLACLLAPGGPATGCRMAYASGWAGDLIAVVGRVPYDLGDWVVGWLFTSHGFFRAVVTLFAAWAIGRGVQYLTEIGEKPAIVGVLWMLRQAVRRGAQLLRFLALTVLIVLGLSHVGALTPFDSVASDALRAAMVIALAFVLGFPAVLSVRYIRSMPSLQGREGHVPARMRALYALISDALWLFMAFLIWLIVVSL
ncbi:MAG: hypothetical protein AB3N11_12720, partial [Arenibacterium sp.]